LKHVAKEGAVGFGILGVEDDVGAVDHNLASGASGCGIIVSPGGGVRKRVRESIPHFTRSRNA
jgi:hypothetical protein